MGSPGNWAEPRNDAQSRHSGRCQNNTTRIVVNVVEMYRGPTLKHATGNLISSTGEDGGTRTPRDVVSALSFKNNTRCEFPLDLMVSMISFDHGVKIDMPVVISKVVGVPKEVADDATATPIDDNTTERRRVLERYDTDEVHMHKNAKPTPKDI